MVLTSVALHVDDSPVFTALAVTREGGALFAEAVYLQAPLEQGPLACILDDGETETPMTVILPALPHGDSRIIMPPQGKTSIGLNIVPEEDTNE